MNEFLSGSWKTTVGGILSGLGLALVAAQETLPVGYRWIGPAMAAIGTVLLGGSAKDVDRHSTQAEVKKSTEVKKEATDEKIAEIKAEVKEKK